MLEPEIKPGLTYTSTRWRGDRKVVRIERSKGRVVVHYIDQRTSRTGNSPLSVFAGSAQARGLVANA